MPTPRHGSEREGGLGDGHIFSVIKDLGYAWKYLDRMLNSRGYESPGPASRRFTKTVSVPSVPGTYLPV